MKNLYGAMLVVAVLFGGVQAAQAEAQIQVQGFVIAGQGTCLFRNENTISLGSYFSGQTEAHTANGNAQAIRFAVACSDGIGYQLYADVGSGGGTFTQRQMSGPGGATLNFNLFTDADRTSIWNSTTNLPAINRDGPVNNPTGTGLNNGIGHDAWFSFPANQTVALGTYSSTITVTLSF